MMLTLCLSVCSIFSVPTVNAESDQPIISNFSEIAPLKKVLMHRPGGEFLNLTPNTLERLLFDDIPYLKTAQEEHDAFVSALKAEGVEVVYLTDLVAEALDAGGRNRHHRDRNPSKRVRFLCNTRFRKNDPGSNPQSLFPA